MANQGRNESKPARKRQLNVIYFVDSSRTRSFKIPLGRLNALIVFFIALGIWSVASIYIFVKLVDDRHTIASRLVSSSETIFEYESRYDRAYDVAYPNGQRVAQQRPQPEASSEKDPEPAKEEVVAEESKPDAAEPAAPVVTEPKTQSADTDKDFPVDVDNPVIEETNDSIKLVFKVMNKGSVKISGYVWAIAEFVPDKGAPMYLSAPDGIKLDTNGVAQRPSGGNRFSIRRFKVKRFNFPIPQGVSGSFKAIRIEVSSVKSDAPSVFKIPVDIRIDSGSAQGGEDLKKTGKPG